jgi:Xaa-Pro aminopeptidase
VNRKEEISAKVQRVRDLMERTGLQGILLKSQADFSWITAGGLNVVTLADVQGVASVLITARDVYFLTNTIEAPRMLEEERLEEFGFTPVVFDWFSGEEASEVARIVPAEKIGCDLPVPRGRFLEKEIRELRYRLLPPEVERYLWLGEKASAGIELVLMDVAGPGMKESEVVGELARVLWKDRIDSVCYQSAADERAYRYRHAIPTEKTIRNYLMLNVNARKWGLVTTVTRSALFGKAESRLVRQYVDTVYIECSMIASTRPGTLLKDIFASTCNTYANLGYADEWKYHHQGGAQGYLNRDYLMKPDSPEVVLEDQCFCWNPSIAGTKSEDAFIVSKDGFVFVTKPVHFPTMEIKCQDHVFHRPVLLER